MALSLKVYNNPSVEEWPGLITRPEAQVSDVSQIVEEIMHQVSADGDLAVRALTSKFDQVDLEDLWLDPQLQDQMVSSLDPHLLAAIDQACKNIQIFHRAQEMSVQRVETMPGVLCWREARPVTKVGLYVPGGTAPLFSTVLMLAIPAQLAGCQDIIMCTPPQEDGSIHPAMVYAAKISGVSSIYRAGGAQAIAAMTYGTETMPRVDKIFGPGNHFVTEAKMYAQSHGVAIDMPAGPSEVLVIADATADPEFVAADMISQAEHGVDSQVVLVTTDQRLLGETQINLEAQLVDLPRKEIALQALRNSLMVLMDDLNQAFAFSNAYAPEHLIVSIERPHDYLSQITNAGSVFVGHYSPESAGDYASGTNHTLPTNGWAKAYSGVSLDSFLKKVTFQEVTKEGLQNLGPTVEAMAEAELLIGHQRAVEVRRKKLTR